MKRTWLVAIGVLCPAAESAAQAPAYPHDLLSRLREAAVEIAGPLPLELRVVTLNPMRAPRNTMVEGEAADTIDGGYPVFQIRYADSWIGVDAAVDRLFVPSSRTFSDAAYDSIQVMLRDASLVVVTHEHHDHIGGLLFSPYGEEIKRHTLLTPAQVAGMRDRPTKPRATVDSATAASFRTVDYDLLKAIAPGVVLLAAPGHSPGSQMIWVTLQDGGERVIAGDIAWHMDGVTFGTQKPAGVSEWLREDRPAIAAQLAWLKEISDLGIPVLLSHDEAALESEVCRGAVARGFVFRP